MAWLTRHGDGVRAALKVTPRAATSGVRGIEVDDAGQAYLAVRVNAPPEAGKANAALIRLLARRWRVPQRDLEVISGTSGRRYILGGETMSYLDAWRLFADVTGARRPVARIGPIITRLAGWTGDLWGKLSGHEPEANSAALALARLPKHYTSDRARRELGYEPGPFRQAVEDAWAWFLAHGYK